MAKRKNRLKTIDDLQSFPKELLKEVTVINRIEALLEDMNLEPTLLRGELRFGDGGRRTRCFHASMIGSMSGHSLCGKYPMGCGRQLYYSFTNSESEKSWDPRIRRIFDTGSAIHAQLQIYLHKVAEMNAETDTFVDEVDVNPATQTYGISAHMDGLYTIKTPSTSIRFGIEIKTINDAGYKGTKSPHPEHIMQGTVYQACLDLPVMLFLYYNKNDSSMAEFVQIFDRDRWEAITEKLKSVTSHIKKGTLPEQEVSFSCSSCQYKGICKPPKHMRGPSVHKMFQLNKLRSRSSNADV